MLRAGALYFAIFISFIVTLILGSVILYTYISNRYADIELLREHTNHNALSGITLAMYDSSLVTPGNTVVYSLYDEEDSTDDVTISKKHWGIYQIIQSSVKRKDYETTKIAMTGTDIGTLEAVAMYMADKDRYLSLCGKTMISGTCYIPKSGVRKAFVEGQSFSGDKLIHGEIKRSKPELPQLQNSIINDNIAWFDNTFAGDDSLIGIEEIQGLDSLSRSFAKGSYILYSDGPVTLDRVVLKGNIRIISLHEIKVTQMARLEDVLLYAPSVKFERGFRGHLQAFARDTIIAGENCEFEYPSAFGLINENINNIYLEIKEYATVSGFVFLYQQNKAVQPPYLKVNANATIHGLVYCPGTVELRGTIEGSLYCQGFTLKTGSSLYENHLLNATINRSALSEFYAGSFLLPGYLHAKNIQWLN